MQSSLITAIKSKMTEIMARTRSKEKGIVLLIVLSIVLIVVILANVVLSIIASQSRLTHHQVGRIQAYYAAQAGINYAIEMLRLGNWPLPLGKATKTYTLCRTKVGKCDVVDDNLPTSIQTVTIVIGDQTSGLPGTNTRSLTVTADYTYTP